MGWWILYVTLAAAESGWQPMTNDLAAYDTRAAPPPAPTTWRASGQAQAQRLILGRFFGLGPRSRVQDMSSYARAHAGAQIRWERRLVLPPHVPGHLSLMPRFTGGYDVMYGGGQPGLPASRSRFPQVPGIRGASALLGAGLDVRWDNRHTPHAIGRQPRAGVYTQAGFLALAGLFGSPTFVHVDAELHALWPQSPRANTALRAQGRWASDARAPFYLQPALGGAHLLRGYAEGRFVAQGAWSIELEQRLWIGRSHVGATTVAWHVDPFVTLGQVWRNRADWQMGWRRGPLWAGGLGLRALWAPRGVLRLDVASDLRCVRGHLGFGYPF